MKTIAIDRGNTNTKVGVFQNDLLKVVHLLDLPQLANFVVEQLPDHVIMSSVLPLTKKEREALLTLLPNILFVNKNLKLPISLDYDTPETLGADRIAAMVGSRKYVSGDALVIDAGSCTTYDWLDHLNIYRGGLITPGRKMRSRAMNAQTGALPLIEINDNFGLIGKSTSSCINNGIQIGSIAEMNGIISEFKNKIPKLSVILTGGDALFFEKQLEIDSFVVSNLVLEGLNAILSVNVGV